MPLSEHFSRYLDTIGDGSGTKNANGNYLSTETDFLISPSGRNILHVARLIIHIEDTIGFTAAKYGNLSALTNGIKISKRRVDDDSIIVDFTDGVPIKTNAQWSILCYDTDLKTWGAGDELLAVRWTFLRAGSHLILGENEKLVVRLNDNLTGLIAHRFLVQGITTQNSTLSHR